VAQPLLLHDELVTVQEGGTNHSLVHDSEKYRKNAVVEYLDYQVPVTQLKGQKGNGDMQAAKRD